MTGERKEYSDLLSVRHELVERRREAASEFAQRREALKASGASFLSWEGFTTQLVQLQNLIEVIDRALEDENRISR